MDYRHSCITVCPYHGTLINKLLDSIQIIFLHPCGYSSLYCFPIFRPKQFFNPNIPHHELFVHRFGLDLHIIWSIFIKRELMRVWRLNQAVYLLKIARCLSHMVWTNYIYKCILIIDLIYQNVSFFEEVIFFKLVETL